MNAEANAVQEAKLRFIASPTTNLGDKPIVVSSRRLIERGRGINYAMSVLTRITQVQRNFQTTALWSDADGQGGG